MTALALRCAIASDVAGVPMWQDPRALQAFLGRVDNIRNLTIHHAIMPTERDRGALLSDALMVLEHLQRGAKSDLTIEWLELAVASPHSFIA